MKKDFSRRNFLEILGVGVTSLFIPSSLLKSPELKQIKQPVKTETYYLGLANEILSDATAFIGVPFGDDGLRQINKKVICTESAPGVWTIPQTTLEPFTKPAYINTVIIKNDQGSVLFKNLLNRGQFIDSGQTLTIEKMTFSILS